MCSSADGGWGLVAQFPAPLKSGGCAPAFQARRAGSSAFRGAGNCATSHDGAAVENYRARKDCTPATNSRTTLAPSSVSTDSGWN